VVAGKGKDSDLSTLDNTATHGNDVNFIDPIKLLHTIKMGRGKTQMNPDILEKDGLKMLFSAFSALVRVLFFETVRYIEAPYSFSFQVQS
jgi:hypothetical protein